MSILGDAECLRRCRRRGFGRRLLHRLRWLRRLRRRRRRCRRRGGCATDVVGSWW